MKITEEQINQYAEEYIKTQQGFILDKRAGFKAGMKKAIELLKPEWIPVTERLPEKDGDSSIYCLVNSKRDGVVVRPYNEYHKCWDDEDGDDHYTEAVAGCVTHWLPLPEEPNNGSLSPA